MATDYKKLALEALSFIRDNTDNEAFQSTVDGTEIDIDKTIQELTPILPDVDFTLSQIVEGKRQLNLASQIVKQNMKLLIMHYMKEAGLEEIIIEDLDVIHSDAGISAGDYMDSVTRVLANGDYFYTHNGERSEETEAGGIESLPVNSLDKLLKRLQDYNGSNLALSTTLTV